MKNETTQGLGNKKLSSYPKHDSLKYWNLKGNVNSHMPIQYENQSESLSWSFSDLSGGKWCLQRKYMCRQHETLDCRKLHKQLSNSCHRSGKRHVWQLIGILLWRFWPGVGIYFVTDIWGWEKFFEFLINNGWMSKFFTEKGFLFGATPAINNDWPVRENDNPCKQNNWIIIIFL
jgi:hypothetical protein